MPNSSKKISHQIFILFIIFSLQIFIINCANMSDQPLPPSSWYAWKSSSLNYPTWVPQGSAMPIMSSARSPHDFVHRPYPVDMQYRWGAIRVDSDMQPDTVVDSLSHIEEDNAQSIFRANFGRQWPPSLLAGLEP